MPAEVECCPRALTYRVDPRDAPQAADTCQGRQAMRAQSEQALITQAALRACRLCIFD